MSPGPLTVAGALTQGQSVSSPWVPPSWPVNQGWGRTTLELEPAGHGFEHWHAGVDLGCDCGTVVLFPAGLYGVARWVDNPGGYGTALRVELYEPTVVGTPAGMPGITRKRTFDVWLGHLRQRLVPDGTELRPGMHIAITNNTGNSTGCHLHFEVRPAGGRYGTDVDPSTLLLNVSASDNGPGFDPFGINALEGQISGGITSAENTLLGVGQAGLGATMLLGGLVIVAFGLRGGNGAQLAGAVRGTISKVRSSSAAREFTRESRAQGEAARDVAEQTAAQREAAAEAAGMRRNTLGAYRAGLISRRVAQERLGERIAPTGRRPTRVAYGRGRKPGVYRARGGGSIEVKDPTVLARRSRVRVSHQRDFNMPAPPVPGAGGEIPF